jgi:hypothetical protein
MQTSVKPGFIAGCRNVFRHPLVVLFVFSLFLSGCALHLEPVDIRSPDRDLFLQGVDDLAGTESPAAFARLAEEFPHSPWTARAKTIGKIQEESRATKVELGQMQKSLDTCRAEREKLAADTRSRDEVQKSLEVCTIEKARLGADIRSLEKHILKLKSLLSESGIAEPSPPAR